MTIEETHLLYKSSVQNISCSITVQVLDKSQVSSLSLGLKSS